MRRKPGARRRAQAAPEPPALQAVLEELRAADLATVKDRERALRLAMDDSAKGPRLIEWLERQRRTCGGGGAW